MISSNSNPQIKQLIKLQNKSRYRKQEGLFLVEGSKLVAEAAVHGCLQKIYLMESREGREEERVKPLLEQYPYEIVSDEVFLQISDTITPQGVIGLVTMPKYSWESLLEGERKQFVVLDDLRDPGNLGTIMRTAEGAGMSGVILSKESVDLFNPKVVRSTMGSIFRVPYYYSDDLVQVLQQLKEQEITLYATAMEGSVVYDQPDYTTGAAVIIGNEANGVSDKVFAQVEKRIRIPMEGQLESLNAAVSCAIVTYEMARQRRNSLLD